MRKENTAMTLFIFSLLAWWFNMLVILKPVLIITFECPCCAEARLF